MNSWSEVYSLFVGPLSSEPNEAPSADFVDAELFVAANQHSPLQNQPIVSRLK